jgi:hypothetical protein
VTAATAPEQVGLVVAVEMAPVMTVQEVAAVENVAVAYRVAADGGGAEVVAVVVREVEEVAKVAVVSVVLVVAVAKVVAGGCSSPRTGKRAFEDAHRRAALSGWHTSCPPRRKAAGHMASPTSRAVWHAQRRRGGSGRDETRRTVTVHAQTRHERGLRARPMHDANYLIAKRARVPI